MTRHWAACFTALAIGFAGAAWAAPFDGSQPLICAALEIYACAPGGACDPESANDVDIPRFLKISVKDKKITGTRPSGNAVDAAIELVRHSRGMMFLQGAQEAFSWTMTIGEPDGKMVIAVTDSDDGVVIFGACTTN